MGTERKTAAQMGKHCEIITGENLDFGPLEWLAGPVQTVEGGYYHPDAVELYGADYADWRTAADLPPEVFNWEILETDPNNETDVYLFVSRLGFPYSPLRDAGGTANEYLNYAAQRRAERIKRAGLETDAAAAYSRAAREIVDRAYTGIAETARIAELCHTGTERHHLKDSVISFNEASTTILLLREAVFELMDVLRRGEAPRGRRAWIGGDLIALGARNPNEPNQRVARTGGGRGNACGEWGNLTAALCNQIFDTLADPRGWKECALDECGRLFKSARTGAAGGKGGGAYCCKRHGARARKREDRARKKENH